MKLNIRKVGVIGGVMPPQARSAFDRLARRAIWLPIFMLAPFVLVIACASPHLDDFCFGSAFIDRGLFGALAANGRRRRTGWRRSVSRSARSFTK